MNNERVNLTVIQNKKGVIVRLTLFFFVLLLSYTTATNAEKSSSFSDMSRFIKATDGELQALNNAGVNAHIAYYHRDFMSVVQAPQIMLWVAPNKMIYAGFDVMSKLSEGKTKEQQITAFQAMLNIMHAEKNNTVLSFEVDSHSRQLRFERTYEVAGGDKLYERQTIIWSLDEQVDRACTVVSVAGASLIENNRAYMNHINGAEQHVIEECNGIIEVFERQLRG